MRKTHGGAGPPLRKQPWLAHAGREVTGEEGSEVGSRCWRVWECWARDSRQLRSLCRFLNRGQQEGADGENWK